MIICRVHRERASSKIQRRLDISSRAPKMGARADKSMAGASWGTGNTPSPPLVVLLLPQTATL